MRSICIYKTLLQTCNTLDSVTFVTTFVTFSAEFVSLFRSRIALNRVCFRPIRPVQIERFGNVSIRYFMSVRLEPLLNAAPMHALVIESEYRLRRCRLTNLFRQELPVLIDMHGATELVATIRITIENVALRGIDHVLLEECPRAYSLIDSNRRSRCRHMPYSQSAEDYPPTDKEANERCDHERFKQVQVDDSHEHNASRCQDAEEDDKHECCTPTLDHNAIVAELLVLLIGVSLDRFTVVHTLASLTAIRYTDGFVATLRGPGGPP